MKCPKCNDEMEDCKEEIGDTSYEAYLCRKCDTVLVPFTAHQHSDRVAADTADAAWGSHEADERREGERDGKV